MSDPYQPLVVELRGGVLVMSIGVSELAALVLAGMNRHRVETGQIVIPDDYALACKTVVEMRRKPDGQSSHAAGFLRAIAAATDGVHHLGGGLLGDKPLERS